MPGVKVFVGYCSPYLEIKEMQIKIILRFHLTPVRMDKVKKKLARIQGKETHTHCWWDGKLV